VHPAAALAIAKRTSAALRMASCACAHERTLERGVRLSRLIGPAATSIATSSSLVLAGIASAAVTCSAAAKASRSARPASHSAAGRSSAGAN
jgi:hypothetical protein